MRENIRQHQAREEKAALGKYAALSIVLYYGAYFLYAALLVPMGRNGFMVQGLYKSVTNIPMGGNHTSYINGFYNYFSGVISFIFCCAVFVIVVNMICAQLFLKKHARPPTTAESRVYCFYVMLWGVIAPFLITLRFRYSLYPESGGFHEMYALFNDALGGRLLLIVIASLVLHYLVARYVFSGYAARQYKIHQQQAPLIKYITLTFVLYWLNYFIFTPLLGRIAGGVDVFLYVIFATFASAVAAHYFVKDHGRAATKGEGVRYSLYTTLGWLFVLFNTQYIYNQLIKKEPIALKLYHDMVNLEASIMGDIHVYIMLVLSVVFHYVITRCIFAYYTAWQAGDKADKKTDRGAGRHSRTARTTMR